MSEMIFDIVDNITGSSKHSIAVAGAEPGNIIDIDPVKIISAYAPVSTDQFFISATTGIRKGSGGTLAEGSEAIEELWLEASFDGASWIPLGGGPAKYAIKVYFSTRPSGMYAPILDGATLPGSPVPGTPIFLGGVALYLRLNIPPSPASFGDVQINLELFGK